MNVRLIVSRVCTFEWKVCMRGVYAQSCGDVTGHRGKVMKPTEHGTVSPAAVLYMDVCE